MLTEPRSDTIRRLQSAAGHLNAVIQMVTRNAPSMDVLHQLCAVQGALRAVTCQLFAERLQIQLERIEENCKCEHREQVAEELKTFYALLAKSEVF